MALYAVDEEELIFAAQAEKGKIYWCLDCFGPVKKRLGKDRLSHFYHIHPTPHCRLYSKTEDHLIAQLDLKECFAPGVLQIERPFLQISRVADLCWENEKIIFEIQCSPLTEKEAEMRIADYTSIGYEVVWLLDDRRYNKRVLRPAEKLVRRQGAYYVSIQRRTYYDQFEIFAQNRRVRKSKPLRLDLKKVRRTPQIDWQAEIFPQQVIELEQKIFFLNSRLDRALKASFSPTLRLSMQTWRRLEELFAVSAPTRFRLWLHRYLRQPYETFLNWLIQKVNQGR